MSYPPDKVIWSLNYWGLGEKRQGKETIPGQGNNTATKPGFESANLGSEVSASKLSGNSSLNAHAKLVHGVVLKAISNVVLELPSEL